MILALCIFVQASTIYQTFYIYELSHFIWRASYDYPEFTDEKTESNVWKGAQSPVVLKGMGRILVPVQTQPKATTISTMFSSEGDNRVFSKSLNQETPTD